MSTLEPDRGETTATSDICSALAGDGDWLAQAIRLRDVAFRLAQNRYQTPSTAGDPRAAGVDPDGVSKRVPPANELTAAFLIESEKMVALMKTLAQRGSVTEPRQ
jgi:hypothetical protein